MPREIRDIIFSYIPSTLSLQYKTAPILKQSMRLGFPVLRNVNRQLREEFMDFQRSENEKLKRRDIRPFKLLQVWNFLYGDYFICQRTDLLFQDIEIFISVGPPRYYDDDQGNKERLITLTVTAVPGCQYMVSCKDSDWQDQRVVFPLFREKPECAEQGFVLQGHALLGTIFQHYIAYRPRDWRYDEVITELNRYGTVWA